MPTSSVSRRRNTHPPPDIVEELVIGVQLVPKFPGLPKVVIKYGDHGLTKEGLSQVRKLYPEKSLEDQIKFILRQTVPISQLAESLGKVVHLNIKDSKSPEVLNLAIENLKLSDTSLGAVLQQKVNNVWKPLAFYSKTMSDTQRRYSELLAMYTTVKRVYAG
ncbi:unnamed protein product [Arctia plantaginis]|uniref:Reverse transcriptase/retrotransposon-derived protein RNase H-like domain-containing protein n=1 Tax=Arctia plantaginis TaxID=874455 RepID=A0A8S0ZNN7_ARCPL|nr:unnamed protein product [Arctia plantaginis]